MWWGGAWVGVVGGEGPVAGSYVAYLVSWRTGEFKMAARQDISRC